MIVDPTLGAGATFSTDSEGETRAWMEAMQTAIGRKRAEARKRRRLSTAASGDASHPPSSFSSTDGTASTVVAAAAAAAAAPAADADASGGQRRRRRRGASKSKGGGGRRRRGYKTSRTVPLLSDTQVTASVRVLAKSGAHAGQLQVQWAGEPLWLSGS